MGGGGTLVHQAPVPSPRAEAPAGGRPDTNPSVVPASLTDGGKPVPCEPPDNTPAPCFTERR